MEAVLLIGHRHWGDAEVDWLHGRRVKVCGDFSGWVVIEDGVLGVRVVPENWVVEKGTRGSV